MITTIVNPDKGYVRIHVIDNVATEFNINEIEAIPPFIKDDFVQWNIHNKCNDESARFKYSHGANCWGVALSIFLRRQMKAAGRDEMYRVFSPRTADELLQSSGTPVEFDQLKPGDIIRFGYREVGGTTHYCTFLRSYWRDDAVVLTKNGIGGMYHVCSLLDLNRFSQCYGNICGMGESDKGFYTRRVNE